ncbi:tRNA-His guanylyltransferase [Nowakowskiella sp. JEL0407]|nr:tRNA-His guanylyltransferase [Nowakowskiella sp. JEL0407]KAJ3129859.1 tRNA-His guanylyltransferase [Nowakowskiella sp. JEL0407]
MAKSKYEYVKNFEQHLSLLPQTYIIIRIDGHCFHHFTSIHNFKKPNDIRALNLANHSATYILQQFPDICLAYGQSDEFSFLFQKNTKLWKRRESKLVSVLVSMFTSCYVANWTKFIGEELKELPSFDGRAVVYPNEDTVKDYFRWRQADCHINNLYNTTFWALVQDPKNPLTETQAEDILKDTDSGLKNEMLFKQFGINYNDIDQMFRKGSVLLRKKVVVENKKSGKVDESGDQTTDAEKAATLPTEKKLRVQPKEKSVVVVEYCDIIRDAFWKENEHLLR